MDQQPIFQQEPIATLTQNDGMNVSDGIVHQEIEGEDFSVHLFQSRYHLFSTDNSLMSQLRPLDEYLHDLRPEAPIEEIVQADGNDNVGEVAPLSAPSPMKKRGRMSNSTKKRTGLRRRPTKQTKPMMMPVPASRSMSRSRRRGVQSGGVAKKTKMSAAKAKSAKSRSRSRRH